jgi:hypothetical protein
MGEHMSRSAYSEISALVDDLITDGTPYEDLTDALRKALHNVALKMSSFSEEAEDVQDDEFDNMPV